MGPPLRRRGVATTEFLILLPVWLAAATAIWTLHDITLGRFEAQRVLRESLSRPDPDRAVGDVTWHRSGNPALGSIDRVLSPLFRFRRVTLEYKPRDWLPAVPLEGTALDSGKARENLWMWMAGLGLASSY